MASSTDNPYVVGYASGLIASQYSEDVRAKFRENIAKGHRMGQAFMNALPVADYQRLAGTDVDPFYSEDPDCIATALDFLMDLT